MEGRMWGLGEGKKREEEEVVSYFKIPIYP